MAVMLPAPLPAASPTRGFVPAARTAPVVAQAGPVPGAAPLAPTDPLAGLNIIGNGPMQDPQYLAFLRASGQTEAEARAAAQAKQDEIDRALQAELPTYKLQLEKNLRDIGNNYLQNGTFQSGQRLYDQSFATAQNQAEVNKVEQNSMNQKSQVEEDLARSLAQEREKQAEQGLAARGNVALGGAAANTASTANAPTVGSGRQAGSSNLTGI